MSRRKHRHRLVGPIAAVSVAALVAAAAAAASGASTAPEPATGTPAESTAAAETAADTATETTTAETTVAANADTYVVKEYPNEIRGTAGKLTAANWDTPGQSPWHTHAYVRFAIPDDSRPLASARLDFTFERQVNQPDRVELHAVSDNDWSETTTSYANRPAVGAVVAEAVIAEPGTATTLSFDVSSSVRAGEVVSFAMTNPTPQSAASVFSRERGPSGPRLVLEYEATETLCGAAFNTEGQTWEEALAREDALFNGLESIRIFYPGLPQAWPGRMDTGDRPVTVSFKANPRDILAGTHDAYLADWFRTAPPDKTVYWVYFHEPEDNIESGQFSAADYRAAWRHLTGLADQAGNPRLHPTLVLMSWTLRPESGRNWRDYYPGREYLDVFAWDSYNSLEPTPPRYRSPDEMFDRLVAVSQGEGLPFAIAEIGTGLTEGDDGTDRAAWLRSVISYLVGHDAVFVQYFDLDRTAFGRPDHRLRDAPSVQAWREFCS